MNDNSKQIAKIVCRYYKRRDGTVRYRLNRLINPAVILRAKQLNLAKPLFKSWYGFIADFSLGCEELFQLFAPYVLITFDAPNGGHWNGNGNFDLIEEFGMSIDPMTYAFTVNLAPQIFEELKPYLEGAS